MAVKQLSCHWSMQKLRGLFLILLILPCVSCAKESTPGDTLSTSTTEETTATAAPAPDINGAYLATSFECKAPFGLPDYYVRPNNPMTHEKVDLGRKLFFDADLSVDRSMSCATCHDPDKGWTNGAAFAKGVSGRMGRRNVPSILNAAYYQSLFWDGRAGSLETQALGPILNPDEMGMPSAQALLERLQQHPEYPELFSIAFEDGLTTTNVAKALASYQRTIVAGNSPYDRFVAGDKNALSPSAQRGLNLFLDRRKTKCIICHEPPTFTTIFYHNLGVGMEEEHPDLGRYEFTNIESNKGFFKVPTMRDVVDTAPYMHDGSIATLEEVMEFYDRGGIPNPHLSKEMRGRLNLTKQEKADLVTFMVEGLTSDDKPTP